MAEPRQPIEPTTETFEHCERMIRVGSRSFSFAARLFAPEKRQAAFFLYGWCRHCDDQVDEGDPAGALNRLGELRASTLSAVSGEPQTDPVFRALAQVVRSHSIPSTYALELLEGMAMDARGETYENRDELALYCYRVAGVVGLMMAHVMGISDSRALGHACDLGIAMQMTNIARDVAEDARKRRVYLPGSWLDSQGIPKDELLLDKNREKLFEVVSRLLKEAESGYRSGDLGLRYLPLRSALAVAVARNVYSDIGKLILRNGPKRLERRAITSKPRKLWAAVRALLQVARLIPGRLIRPWSPASIQTIWRIQ